MMPWAPAENQRYRMNSLALFTYRCEPLTIQMPGPTIRTCRLPVYAQATYPPHWCCLGQSGRDIRHALQEPQRYEPEASVPPFVHIAALLYHIRIRSTAHVLTSRPKRHRKSSA
eukprot:422479-Pyramimonas_sp.AAC.2